MLLSESVEENSFACSFLHRSFIVCTHFHTQLNGIGTRLLAFGLIDICPRCHPD